MKKFTLFFKKALGYTHVTRCIPRGSNEVHTISCSFGKMIKNKRYLKQAIAHRLIIYGQNKKTYDGCKFCMPEWNSSKKETVPFSFTS